MPDTATLKQALITSPAFYVVKAEAQRLVAMRRTFAPRSGLLRLLIPRIHIIATLDPLQPPTVAVRPDLLTVFMVVMLLGGVWVEIFFERSVYPRTYPPEFIYGLTIVYLGWLLVEFFRTRRAVNQLLDRVG